MGIEEIKNTAQHEIISRFFLFTLPGWRPMSKTKKSEANKHIDDGQRTKANAKIYYWQQQPVKTKLGP